MVVPTYGENLRVQRRAAKLTQEQLAKKLELSRQGNLPTVERGKDVPEPTTVLRHAQAIGCLPSELLRGVRTLYDRIRDGEFDRDADAAIAEARLSDLRVHTVARRRLPKRRPR